MAKNKSDIKKEIKQSKTSSTTSKSAPNSRTNLKKKSDVNIVANETSSKINSKEKNTLSLENADFAKPSLAAKLDLDKSIEKFSEKTDSNNPVKSVEINSSISTPKNASEDKSADNFSNKSSDKLSDKSSNEFSNNSSDKISSNFSNNPLSFAPKTVQTQVKISAQESENQKKDVKKDRKKFFIDLGLRAKLQRLFHIYLVKSGSDSDPQKISKSIFYFAVFLNFMFSIYVVYFLNVKFNYPILYTAFLIILIWILIFSLIIFSLYLLFFLMLDFRIFKRTQDIEDVLPDFLELTSANIRAGMPIDQALWFSVRPRFGVLAKEIETVAKETLSGEPLEDALLKFTSKYDSSVLDRSVNLLIEGMRAGGELGDLLNKISSNIQESRIIKKEMSANVTTYVIFISFAAIVAAPVLFALSGQVLLIVGKIMQNLAQASGGGVTTGVSIKPKGFSVSFADFQMFSIALLVITAFFSSLIVSIIKRGNIKSGISYIPRFIAVSLVVYWIASKILASTLGGFF